MQDVRLIFEILVSMLLCVCLILLAVSRYRQKKKREEPERKEMDLIDFFSLGGVAYYWNKGGKQQKCYTYEEFLKIKADYVELWLNQHGPGGVVGAAGAQNEHSPVLELHPMCIAQVGEAGVIGVVAVEQAVPVDDGSLQGI